MTNIPEIISQLLMSSHICALLFCSLITFYSNSSNIHKVFPPLPELNLQTRLCSRGKQHTRARATSSPPTPLHTAVMWLNTCIPSPLTNPRSCLFLYFYLTRQESASSGRAGEEMFGRRCWTKQKEKRKREGGKYFLWMQSFSSPLDAAQRSAPMRDEKPQRGWEPEKEGPQPFFTPSSPFINSFKAV